MRRFLTLITLAALGIFGWSQLGGRGPAQWQKFDNGLELCTISKRSGLSKVSITAVRAPANRVHVATKSIERAPQWAAKTGAIAVINGGYFDDKTRPLGLRIAGGKRTNALYARANWGVFAIRDGVASIAHTRDYKGSPRTQEAMQCGPRLVVNGQPTDLKEQWARRSGIGIDARGRVVLAVSDGALSFDDWANLWADGDGLNCPDALNMDGGGSTQMTVASKKNPVEVRGAWPIPDVILVK